MRTIRARLDGWIIPPLVVGLTLLAVAAAVLIVKVGEREQGTHRIPAVASVSICVAPINEADPCLAARSPQVRLGEAEANQLAAAINALGGPLSYTKCTAGDWPAYYLTFATSGRPVTAHVPGGGCSVIGVTAVGQDWGTARWDRDGVVRAAIAANLRAATAQS